MRRSLPEPKTIVLLFAFLTFSGALMLKIMPIEQLLYVHELSAKVIMLDGIFSIAKHSSTPAATSLSIGLAYIYSIISAIYSLRHKVVTNKMRAALKKIPLSKRILGSILLWAFLYSSLLIDTDSYPGQKSNLIMSNIDKPLVLAIWCLGIYSITHATLFASGSAIRKEETNE